MFLATTNKAKRLLHLSFIGEVKPHELEQGREDLAVLLKEMSSGLHILGDLERLGSMGQNCAEAIGKVMEMLDQHGVELIVRVVPHPAKDIGFNIFMLFHYQSRPRVVVCETMLQAAGVLGL